MNSPVAELLPWDRMKPPPEGAGNFADASALELFPRLNVISDYEDMFPATAPVGSFGENDHGVADMLGNAWEWTGAAWDSKGDVTFSGGAWTTSHMGPYLPGMRMKWSPDLRRNDIGFRCVLVLDGR